MESNDAELQRKNSVLTQQWLETLNNLQNQQINQTQSRSAFPNTYVTQQSLMNRQKHLLLRDSSFQSDDSHCSSIESVLELRKPDPEEVLLGLGFGPRRNSNYIGRIPARFLQPSKLIPHIDINKFLERYGENYADLPQNGCS
ncbi:protein ITPRID2 isoform X2 [Dendroctonus ponderosae]|uniref:protein ITPRID2 isoform X2 n=1 Tax=Dendroctonus ponderosae TaxID=77166 RepID=UPI002034C926|nr:protein ITPRID2 isoform X2 [Dendroctonus ponderosae]